MSKFSLPKIQKEITTLRSQAEVDLVKSRYKIFCDGSCHGNPGPVGYGVSIFKLNSIHKRGFGGYQPAGTNNLAELNALFTSIFEALQLIERNSTRSVAIFSDSKYALESVVLRGEKITNGRSKPVNASIIAAAWNLYKQISGKVVFYHVLGHKGVHGNEEADRLARAAIGHTQSRYVDYPYGSVASKDK